MAGGRRRLTPLAALQALLAAAALILGAAAVAVLAWQGAGQGAYDRLDGGPGRVAATVTEDQAASGEDDAIEEAPAWEWDVEGACAWVSVEGTSVDYPVAAQDPDDPDWYLRHDLWGDWSMLGCPFLDARGGAPDARQLLVFGHHIAYTDYVFSGLQHAYEQDAFDEIGVATWSTRAGQTTYVPLCAMAVDETYAKVQSFDAGSDAAVREWLAELLADADARAEGADEIATRATGALCLVTCSSDWAGQSGRTVVVFAKSQG